MIRPHMDEREYLKQLQKLLEKEDDVHETIRSAEDRLKAAEKELIDAREHLCLREKQAKHDGEAIQRQRQVGCLTVPRLLFFDCCFAFVVMLCKQSISITSTLTTSAITHRHTRSLLFSL